MIQLATDPTASKTSFRPQGEESKPQGFDARRRTGHAWPFLARNPDRPARQDSPKPASESGS